MAKKIARRAEHPELRIAKFPVSYHVADLPDSSRRTLRTIILDNIDGPYTFVGAVFLLFDFDGNEVTQAILPTTIAGREGIKQFYATPDFIAQSFKTILAFDTGAGQVTYDVTSEPLPSDLFFDTIRIYCFSDGDLQIAVEAIVRR